VEALTLAVGAFMAGVIWFVQIVHYPLMADVGRGAWVAYEERHRRLTTFVVAGPMLAEPVLAGVVLARGEHIWIGCGLLVAAVVPLLVTALVSVAEHERLSAGFDAASHRRLVRTNWLRTAGWTAYAVLAAVLVSL